MTKNTPVLLNVNDLNYQVAGKTILQKVSFDIAAREIITVIGPNGAGKTSLLRLLLGLENASAGNVVKKEGLRIGYMPQKLTLDPNLPLTVDRFLAFADKHKQTRKNIMQRLGISKLARTLLYKTSGGELQRVLLARALLRKPELLILDEPVQGVDVRGQNELYALIAKLRDEFNCGILMVSHDLHLVMSATDKVICLNQHICCQGHPEQVSQDPAFLQLFGDNQDLPQLAVYSHHHDHSHDMHGDVITKKADH